MASILWHYIMLHCIALHWHMELCREPMVPTVPVQHRLLGITMQLHTLLGMKAGVHMHPCAYIIGLAYRCSFVPWWVWRQEIMCIYMHFCMVLGVGCEEVCCDILWIVMSHAVLWLIRLWIYYTWIVWILGYWFNVVALKLTWEEILFLVRWVTIWLKGSWSYYLFSFLAIYKPFNFFTCYLFGYGIWSTFMQLYLSRLLW